jgi:hypothetical protein
MSGPARSYQRPVRVREAHISWVAERLGERDKAIIRTIAMLRLANSIQLERIHFTDITPTSRASVRRRVLGRLVSWRVLMTLERRIGGVRAGSAGLVFALDTTGRRLAQIDASGRRQTPLPGALFVRHTLAVSELYVALTERSHDRGFTVATFQAEPNCWWPNGLGAYLKPDAFTLLAASSYADAWWIEQDMGTESLPTIRRKLASYLDFVRRGQLGPTDVMPRVLISVPQEARHAAVRELIQRMPEPGPQLFHCAVSAQAPEYLIDVLQT